MESKPPVKLFVSRQWAQLIGTNIRTWDKQKRLLCFGRTKAFKLREEVVFYSDEARTKEMFHMKARNIIDLSPTFDLLTSDGKLFGSLKRDGLTSSFVRDHWLILDSQGQQVGDVNEDDSTLSVLRRYVDFITYFSPQTYSIRFGDTTVATIKQRKNPFTVRYDYEISADAFSTYELLFYAIANALALIEARQS